jgi:ClpP class serine protease
MATTPKKQASKPTTPAPQLSVIEKLEAVRKSKVIVYITGDRKLQTGVPLPPGVGLSTQVATDVLPFFDEALRGMGDAEKVTLVVYTNGGGIEAPWPLVNLIRDFCKELEVIVLKKALSAGTLIALGADKIVMPRGSYLSPVDPAAQMVKEKQVKKVEIEDIIGFVDFAKDKVGINDQQTLGEILKELSKEVDPSQIGSINRTHSLIRKLAKKLLETHRSQLPEHQLKELVEQLTEKLFSHTHLISRREAQDIGFGNLVEEPDPASAKLIDELFDEYSAKMKLNEPIIVERVIANQQAGTPTGYAEKCITAVVHSACVQYSLESQINIRLIDSGQDKKINVATISLGWAKEG